MSIKVTILAQLSSRDDRQSDDRQSDDRQVSDLKKLAKRKKWGGVIKVITKKTSVNKTRLNDRTAIQELFEMVSRGEIEICWWLKKAKKAGYIKRYTRS